MHITQIPSVLLRTKFVNFESFIISWYQIENRKTVLPSRTKPVNHKSHNISQRQLQSTKISSFHNTDETCEFRVPNRQSTSIAKPTISEHSRQAYNPPCYCLTIFTRIVIHFCLLGFVERKASTILIRLKDGFAN